MSTLPAPAAATGLGAQQYGPQASCEGADWAGLAGRQSVCATSQLGLLLATARTAVGAILAHALDDAGHEAVGVADAAAG